MGSIYHHCGSRYGVVTALYAQRLGELTSTLAAAVLGADDSRLERAARLIAAPTRLHQVRFRTGRTEL